MALFSVKIDQCTMHRFHLENRFPKLVFHFLKDEAIPDKVVVRIFRRDEIGSYQKTAVTGAYHDEHVDPETFPDDLFMTKCILIA